MPQSRSIKTLALAALECRGCPLFEDTTQTVFGKGPASAALILVGEQPGDVEDKRGVPFVLRADDRAAEVRAALVADLKAAWRCACSE